jgi:predicted nucleic acid-binding protein
VKIVDSTVAIDHLRGHEPAVALLERTIETEELGASEVVRFEVLAGRREAELEPTEQLFVALTWFPIDEMISRLAGLLARRFRQSHAGIAATDYIIAATALALDAELLTTDVRHFPMLEGLRPAY